MKHPDGSARFAFVSFLMLNDSYLPGALTVAYALEQQATGAPRPGTTELGVEVLDEFRQLLARQLVALATPDRAASRSLHEFEKLFTALFADQVADHGAHRAHVVAQRLVLVLEHDVLTTQCFVWPGNHGD